MTEECTCKSVIFRQIFQSQTPVKSSVHNLNIDTLFLKVGPEMAYGSRSKLGNVSNRDRSTIKKRCDFVALPNFERLA